MLFFPIYVFPFIKAPISINAWSSIIIGPSDASRIAPAETFAELEIWILALSVSYTHLTLPTNREV